MRLTVAGTGYVGLVTGACLADMGNEVTCLDTDHTKIDKLRQGHIPLYEPQLGELVRKHAAAERLRFTHDWRLALRGADICFIAVGTPTGPEGQADLQAILAATDAIATNLSGPLVIALKSTAPVGTGDAIETHLRAVLAKRHERHDVAVVNNPEFLKEGMAVDDFMRPDRIVIGAADEAPVDVMRRVYAPFLRSGRPFLVMDRCSAEMTKYASNAFLAARISLINEIAMLCEPLGADITLVRQGVGTDSRIGPAFLYAGLGYGGSCFSKDMLALQHMGRNVAVPTPLLPAIESANERQKSLWVRRLQDYFGTTLPTRRIAIWGLAFKPRTDDVRHAPALTIIEQLLELGAHVLAYDPEAETNARAALPKHARLHFASDPYTPLSDADALLLCTEWGIFQSPDFSRIRALMRTPLILDGRNQYDGRELTRQGFHYVGVGRQQNA